MFVEKEDKKDFLFFFYLLDARLTVIFQKGKLPKDGTKTTFLFLVQGLFSITNIRPI